MVRSLSIAFEAIPVLSLSIGIGSNAIDKRMCSVVSSYLHPDDGLRSPTSWVSSCDSVTSYPTSSALSHSRQPVIYFIPIQICLFWFALPMRIIEWWSFFKIHPSGSNLNTSFFLLNHYLLLGCSTFYMFTRATALFGLWITVSEHLWISFSVGKNFISFSMWFLVVCQFCV